MMKKALASASTDLEKLLATHKPETTSKYAEVNYSRLFFFL